MNQIVSDLQGMKKDLSNGKYTDDFSICHLCSDMSKYTAGRVLPIKAAFRGRIEKTINK